MQEAAKEPLKEPVANMSENAAHLAVSKNDFTLKTVERVLELTTIPFSKARKNVIPIGEEGVGGVILGLYQFAGQVGISNATVTHPWLTRLLTGFAKIHDPRFHFSAIQVNWSYQARAHTDKFNPGPSLMIGVGKHTGETCGLRMRLATPPTRVRRMSRASLSKAKRSGVECCALAIIGFGSMGDVFISPYPSRATGTH